MLMLFTPTSARRHEFRAHELHKAEEAILRWQNGKLLDRAFVPRAVAWLIYLQGCQSYME